MEKMASEPSEPSWNQCQVMTYHMVQVAILAALVPVVIFLEVEVVMPHRTQAQPGPSRASQAQTVAAVTFLPAAARATSQALQAALEHQAVQALREEVDPEARPLGPKAA